MARLEVLIGTRKGLFVLACDAQRRSWSLDAPHFLGEVDNHAVLDPRDGRTLLAAVRAGHLGPTVYRSEDFGGTWKEAQTPPAFRKALAGERGETVSHVFWLTPGHASQPGRWYAGTSPPGLFVSEDAGRSWKGVAGFNENPERIAWCGGLPCPPPHGPPLPSPH